MRTAGQPYRDGAPIPQGYHVEEKMRKSAISIGSIVFPLSYGLTTVSSLFGGSAEYLMYPVMGPFLTMAKRDNFECGDGSLSSLCTMGDVSIYFVLTVFAIAQISSLASIGIGILYKEKRLIKDSSRAKVQLSPILFKSGGGVGANGRF